MYTLFVGEEEVTAYVKDLLVRLEGRRRATLWCSIGQSGDELAVRLLEAIRDNSKIELIRVSYNRKTKRLTTESQDRLSTCKGRDVLVLDSAVHSGSTMAAVAAAVSANGARSITTYTLVLKRSSCFVPSFWAVMIDDPDRTYFLLKSIPNNRLGGSNHAFHLRRLSREDLGRPLVRTAVESLNRITWADRYYDMVNGEAPRWTYLLEACGSICGFITFEQRKSARLLIQEVAVDKKYQKKGYGKALMRWAETCARQSNAAFLSLWGIEEAVEWYRCLKFKTIPKQVMDLDGEKYQEMQKRILYHIDLAASPT